MYRARVIKREEQTISFMFIDYGDREIKVKADLWMRPDKMLTMPPAVIKVDIGGKTVNIEQEDKLVGEEVVLRMVLNSVGNFDRGGELVKFFETDVREEKNLSLMTYFDSAVILMVVEGRYGM